MTFPLLTLKHIHKKFGYRTILHDINLDINLGEVVLLLGNNGAGKSTLLRIVSSLMLPSQGEILFKGQNHRKDLSTYLQAIGCVFHESRLYGDLTAVENLKLYGTLYGTPHLEKRIEDSLEEVELGYAAHLPVKTFSSGMTKRLAIARTMLYQPEILLLDEPYTGLDQHFVKQFQQFLKLFHQNGGSILLVTHQLELGLALATRGLILGHRSIRHDVSVSEMDLDRCQQWLEEC
ncbi:heme ABC exporter ATP-binding protein CcmA [Deltaproteobacteria bacterium TL4]